MGQSLHAWVVPCATLKPCQHISLVFRGFLSTWDAQDLSSFFENGYFLKWWYPQIIYFNRIFQYKPSIFGYPHLWKPPKKSLEGNPEDVPSAAIDILELENSKLREDRARLEAELETERGELNQLQERFIQLQLERFQTSDEKALGWWDWLWLTHGSWDFGAQKLATSLGKCLDSLWLIFPIVGNRYFQYFHVFSSISYWGVALEIIPSHPETLI